MASRSGGVGFLGHRCAHHPNLPSEVGPRQHHRPGRGPDSGPQTIPTSVPQKAHTPLLTERQRKGRLRSRLQSVPKQPRPEPHGHIGTTMPPTQTDALTLPDNDLAMHAGEQIFGVSRYSEEDPGQSRNDLGSMHTFSAVPPDQENIHPDWIGRFSAAMRAKHLGGMEGDGARALRPEIAAAIPILGAAAPAGASQPPTSANTCVDIGAVAASSVTVARKRKGRGKGNNVARDERKRQRRVAFLLTTQGNRDTEAGTRPARPDTH